MQAFYHLFHVFCAKLFHLFLFCRVKKFHLFRFLSIQGFARFSYFCQSMPRRQAGSLVPCALWCATQAQQRPWRGQSFGQGQSMWLCGQGMGIFLSCTILRAKVVKKIDIRKRLFLFIVKFVPKGTSCVWGLFPLWWISGGKGTSYDPDLGNK